MDGWMEGRVCLITDGCSSVGTEVAVSLAKMEATVVIVARDAQAGLAAQAEIRQRSCNPRVELIVSHLATRDDVLEVATDFLCDYERLDVLVNNAELISYERALTVEGWESTFAVNHLAPFLLTQLLLEQLKPTEPLRIVNVTTGKHARALSLANLNGDHDFDPARAFAAAKLLNVLFTYELARRTEGTPVTVNCVHPGPALPLLSSAKSRALGPLFLATSPMLEGVNGKYFVKMKESRSAGISYDTALAGRLWNLSTQYVGRNAAPQPPPPATPTRFLASNPAFS